MSHASLFSVLSRVSLSRAIGSGPQSRNGEYASPLECIIIIGNYQTKRVNFGLSERVYREKARQSSAHVHRRIDMDAETRINSLVPKEMGRANIANSVFVLSRGSLSPRRRAIGSSPQSRNGKYASPIE